MTRFCRNLLVNQFLTSIFPKCRLWLYWSFACGACLTIPYWRKNPKQFRALKDFEKDGVPDPLSIPVRASLPNLRRSDSETPKVSCEALWQSNFEKHNLPAKRSAPK